MGDCGGRVDNVDKLVLVGGRWARGLRFDDLACRILEADDGLNDTALIPPQKDDGPDDQKRPDHKAR
jgi:hypothetical protein